VLKKCSFGIPYLILMPQEIKKIIKNPTPEGPDLVTPRRGYSALPPLAS